MEAINKDKANKIISSLPSDEKSRSLAELFKNFGDATRIRILYALYENEICVNDLAELLNMTQSAISHQLRVLKQSRLISSRREGKLIYYSLADEHVRSLLSVGMEHVCEED
ncbi:MAG: helix-turn-helix transcriptional regulator [Lachnospiraceae bacterium]|nr:helix-turn-helix transcriptional regulator [Lachnospiraceae bacterium]MBR1875888.1 helix-turn-helix transcriptional regulator [Lachnospiraceae bacterium]